MRTVALVSTGTEILQGLYADTNAQWLAEQCTRLGLRVVSIAASPDDLADLKITIGQAAARADLVISTGGLGPTEDDLNRWVFAEIWGRELVQDAEAIRLMRERFSGRGRTMPESNLVQAMVLSGCTVLQNAQGTAPGFYLEGTDDKPALVALPGPPRELKPMFLNQVELLIRPLLEGQVYSRLRVLHIFGQPESTVNERIQPVFRWHPQVQVGILARNYGIDLRIHAHGSTEAETIDLSDRTEEKLRAGLPSEWIYGCDEETLVGAVAAKLKERGLVISTAESCTGGLVAKMLTDPAGSSAYFREGVVTYSNEAKEQHLGVSREILETHGAVSRECVDAMVCGLRARTGADVCTAISGIAGPDGAVAGKPVGTVIVGLSVGDSDPEIHELKLVQDREMNRMLSALSVLNLVRLRLMAPVGNGFGSPS